MQPFPKNAAYQKNRLSGWDPVLGVACVKGKSAERAEIFVVEQNCVYQDLDDKDYESLHVFFEENGKVTAYLRAFRKDADTVQMGRVLTLEHGKGLGGVLLKEGIRQVCERQKPEQIYIEAQCYATGYYEREGFEICSDPFLEDGIPHIRMILSL